MPELMLVERGALPLPPLLRRGKTYKFGHMIILVKTYLSMLEMAVFIIGKSLRGYPLLL